MNTQISMIMKPDEARRLAVDLLTAAQQCTVDGQRVKIHSFGTHASAWKVETPVFGEM